MEFMSQGVPVVVSRNKVDTFYFEEGVVHFFRSGDSGAMADAMLDVINDTRPCVNLLSRGDMSMLNVTVGAEKRKNTWI